MNVNEKRIKRNQRDADKREIGGFRVERNLHPNGAYFAVYGDTHNEKEITVARIFAENGISMSLGPEGASMRLPSGDMHTFPSFDGKIQRILSHEIRSVEGKPNVKKVVKTLIHSYKEDNQVPSATKQADVAISFSPKGHSLSPTTIARGVKEYKKGVKNGKIKARPLMYFHVDEGTRSVYYWSLK